jgi:hypothetical protein
MQTHVRCLVLFSTYRDSVWLLHLSHTLESVPGVQRVAVMMGTPPNKTLLQRRRVHGACRTAHHRAGLMHRAGSHHRTCPVLGNGKATRHGHEHNELPFLGMARDMAAAKRILDEYNGPRVAPARLAFVCK